MFYQECLNASEKLRQAQRQNEWLQKSGAAGAQLEESSAMQAMLETKVNQPINLFQLIFCWVNQKKLAEKYGVRILAPFNGFARVMFPG